MLALCVWGLSEVQIIHLTEWTCYWNAVRNLGLGHVLWNDLSNGKCTCGLEIWMWAFDEMKVSGDSLQRMREVEITFGGTVGRRLGQGRHWRDQGTVLLYVGKKKWKAWVVVSADKRLEFVGDGVSCGCSAKRSLAWYCSAHGLRLFENRVKHEEFVVKRDVVTRD